jgi:hypothetical protein
MRNVGRRTNCNPCCAEQGYAAPSRSVDAIDERLCRGFYSLIHTPVKGRFTSATNGIGCERGEGRARRLLPEPPGEVFSWTLFAEDPESSRLLKAAAPLCIFLPECEDRQRALKVWDTSERLEESGSDKRTHSSGVCSRSYPWS